jgi:hypothetical protein
LSLTPDIAIQNTYEIKVLYTLRKPLESLFDAPFPGGNDHLDGARLATISLST